MSDTAPTHPERILSALQAAARPMSDTELATVTGIAPRTQTNQTCNRLSRDGSVVRERGKGGLCVSDEAAIEHLRGRSWQARAIEALSVELVVITLPDDVVEGIETAQRRQFR